MLILAGVSINAIVGENGILTRTQYATFLNEMSAVEEAVQMWKAGEIIDAKGEDTKAIPAKGLCKINDLTSTERLVGEVGYYRSWSTNGTIPTINILSSTSSFNIEFEGDLIFYPAGVQDLYYLNNEALGLKENKTYLIDAATGMIYSMTGISLKGVSCYSSNMAKAVMNGVSTAPVFAEAEVSGTTTGVANAGNTEPEFLPDGSKNPNYNPNGFRILGNSETDNIYKLYNNGDLFGKGLKSLGLDNSDNELEEVSQYNWKKLEIPSCIGNYKKAIMGYKTIFVIDGNDELWAWGDNSSNKLGLTEEQMKEFTGRDPIKLMIQNTVGDRQKVKNIYSYNNTTLVLTTNNEFYACGNNQIEGTTIYGLLGTNQNVSTIESFTKIEGLPNKNVKKVVADRAYTTQKSMLILYEDGSIYKLGYNSKLDLEHKLIAYEYIQANEFEEKIIDIEVDEDKPLIMVLNNGTVYERNFENNTKKNTKITEFSNIVSIKQGRAYYPYFLEDNSGNKYVYLKTKLTEDRIKLYCGDLGFDFERFYATKNEKDEYIIELNSILPEEMLKNDSVKDIFYSGDSVSIGIFYIMNSGKVYGAGNLNYLGLGSDYVNSANSSNLEKVKLIIDSKGNSGISTLNNVHIDGTSNSKFESSLVAFPWGLCSGENVYITGNSSIMYGNSIIQAGWKKIAENVKEVFIGGNTKLGIIDNDGNGYVILADSRDIGVNSISENVVLGNNFKEIIVDGIKGNVKNISFSYGATFVLTTDGKLYSAGKGKFDATWVNNAYNGRDDEVDEILKLLDTEVIDFASSGKNSIVTGNIYIKSGENGGIYFIGPGDYKGLPGAINASKGGNVVPVRISVNGLSDYSSVKKIYMQWSSTYILDQDGNMYLGGEDCGNINKFKASKGYSISKYTPNELGVNENIMDFVNRRSDAILLTDSGKVYGYGAKMNLGINSNSSSPETEFKYLDIDNVTSICTTKEAYIVIKNDGTVWGTGKNTYGVLGRWNGIGRGDSNSRYKTALNWVECPELEI